MEDSGHPDLFADVALPLYRLLSLFLGVVIIQITVKIRSTAAILPFILRLSSTASLTALSIIGAREGANKSLI